MYADVILDSLTVSLAGAVLSLDRTAAFQTMVSRPIVTAPIIGYLIGSPWTGLLAGMALELLFIGDPPVGAYVPVHETGLSVLVTAMAVTAVKAAGASAPLGQRGSMVQAMLVIPAVILVALPVAKLYQKADSVTRGFNSRIFRRVEENVASGRQVNVFRENLLGLVPFFLTNLITVFATSFVLMSAVYAASSVFTPDELMVPAFAGCLVLGLASAYNALETGRGIYIFAFSGFLATILWVFVRGI